MPIIPSRRKMRPIRSKISVKAYTVPIGDYGLNVSLNANPNAAGTIQQSQKTRLTESVALTRALYEDVVLSPEHALALSLEIEGKQPIKDRAGVIQRRGLNGIVLYKWVAKRMRDQGYDHTAQSVEYLLSQCDFIYSLTAG